MSQYIEFYLKSKNGEFLPVGCFSRSSYIYRAFSLYTPYENGAPFGPNDLKRVVKDIEAERDSFKAILKKAEWKKDELLKSADTLDEKYGILENFSTTKEDCLEEIEAWESARSYINFLCDIVEDVKYLDDGYDCCNYLWVGIEWVPNHKEEE